MPPSERNSRRSFRPRCHDGLLRGRSGAQRRFRSAAHGRSASSSPSVAAVDGAILRRALALGWPDFEDAVCAAAAEAASCDLLVTRDADGFKDSPVPVAGPRDGAVLDTRRPGAGSRGRAPGARLRLAIFRPRQASALILADGYRQPVGIGILRDARAKRPPSVPEGTARSASIIRAWNASRFATPRPGRHAELSPAWSARVAPSVANSVHPGDSNRRGSPSTSR